MSKSPDKGKPLPWELEETVVYISSKNRLPTAENNERAIHGLRHAEQSTHSFTFGTPELFEGAGRELPPEGAVYLGF